MVKNNIEVDVKVKCIEQGKTQAKLAEEIETAKAYVNRVIKRNESVVNNTFVKMLEDIKSLIYVVRGQQVMLDSDLAMLYQVETKVFNQAVSRNIERFPENFRFQLTKEEFDALRSQIATSNGRGGRRYRHTCSRNRE